MIRSIVILAAGLALAAGAAEAKPCRDASGKFIACPAPAARKAAGPCRDAAGHFAKCGATPAIPAQPASRTASNGGILDMMRRRATPATPATPPARSAATAGRPASATVPGTPTARCRDGTLSYSQHRSGTCAGHQGVATWL